MTPRDEPPLSADELASLRAVSQGEGQIAIPAEHQERLIHLGFIRPVLNTVLLTAAGAKYMVSREPAAKDGKPGS